ncbi:MAG: lamin tail domain-containing protein [Saprospiraceae bacterium]|nr:lamin tail domain-containing protein [Saprospiraceae bacterium]
MRRFLPILLFLFAALYAHSQIVITELSYNPPEDGTDSLEYIELYNAGTQSVNLEGYKITRGVTHTFGSATINAGEYMLVVVKSAAFETVYGISAMQWTSGALSNGGERITLADAAGTEIVDFTLSDMAPWPTIMEGTDGDGRSIELCNPLADPNDGNNWKVSENDLMIVLNGKNIYGTPGAGNSIPPCGSSADVTVIITNNQFTPKDITINVGETVRWDNTEGVHNVNGSLATFPSNPEGFLSGVPAAAPWTFDYTFTKPGFYNYQCDLHANGGMTGTVTVIEDVVIDEYPLRTIASLKGVNGEGVADSLGIKCTVEGVVYGINVRQGGLQFTIQDNNGRGIGIFNASNSLGYSVIEGDRLSVKGTVAQFRGLTQINADNINVLAIDQSLVPAKVVTSFTEENESGLLTVQNVSFIDRSQWTGMGAGFNVDMTNGQTTFSIRIDNDVNLYTQPAPTGDKFNVTGLLSQFSINATPPLEGGYQLLPRYMNDFVLATSTFDTEIFSLQVFPNPASDYIQITKDIQVEAITIFRMDGTKVADILLSDKIAVNTLSAGNYQIIVKSKDAIYTGRFIKF